MSPDKLVYMANQIGKFFASQGAEQGRRPASPSTSRNSGTRACARAIFAHLDAGGAGLDPLVREAIEQAVAHRPPKEAQAAINS